MGGGGGSGNIAVAVVAAVLLQVFKHAGGSPSPHWRACGLVVYPRSKVAMAPRARRAALLLSPTLLLTLLMCSFNLGMAGSPSAPPSRLPPGLLLGCPSSRSLCTPLAEKLTSSVSFFTSQERRRTVPDRVRHR